MGGFTQAIARGFGNYVTFSGRAARWEYWWWALFVVLGSIVTALIDIMVLGAETQGVVNLLFNLAVLLPGLAVAVRRLHDIDRSGWWLLIVLIPLVGILLLLVWFIQSGTAGPNRFGADPLAGGY